MTISTYTATTLVGTAYTSVGNTAITFMSLCNYSTNDITANVYIVPSGGTASNTNVVLKNLPLTPADTYQFYAGGEKILLDTGDTIQVQANAATSLTVVTSYTTI